MKKEEEEEEEEENEGICNTIYSFSLSLCVRDYNVLQKLVC